jgi:hypothetical protein
MTSRAERASRLRPIVREALRDQSLRDLEDQIPGVSRTALGNFAAGATPHDRTLQRIEEWVKRRGLNGGEPDEGGPRTEEDERLVAELLDVVAEERWSQEEVERRVPGVTQNDVSRWINDNWVRMTSSKRRAVRDFLVAHAKGEHLIELAGARASASEVGQWIGTLDGRARKLDALDALRRVLSITGPVPEWWYRLREEVESE